MKVLKTAFPNPIKIGCMNETLKLLLQRRTIRKYTDKPISAEQKQLVLTAAMRAPTAGAMMLYSIIEICDPALKQALSESCDHQPFIAHAPWLLLFAADYQRWYDFYQLRNLPERCSSFGRQARTPQEGDFLLACMDGLIAAQSAVIAAESLGIGSCYIGDIIEQYEFHQQLLNLPRYSAPIALICFGFPAAGQSEQPQCARFDPKYILHRDRYHPIAEKELDRMFPLPDMDKEGTYKGLDDGERNYFRKFTADFSVEMSRSVREMLKNWRSEGHSNDENC